MAELNLIEACDRALVIVSRTREMDRLYQKAVKCLGEGRLRTCIMEVASEALTDETLGKEVFAGPERVLSFFCGIWIQYLLVEIGGVKKEKLKDLATKALDGGTAGKSIH